MSGRAPARRQPHAAFCPGDLKSSRHVHHHAAAARHVHHHGSSDPCCGSDGGSGTHRTAARWPAPQGGERGRGGGGRRWGGGGLYALKAGIDAATRGRFRCAEQASHSTAAAVLGRARGSALVRKSGSIVGLMAPVGCTAGAAGSRPCPRAPALSVVCMSAFRCTPQAMWHLPNLPCHLQGVAGDSVCMCIC